MIVEDIHRIQKIADTALQSIIRELECNINFRNRPSKRAADEKYCEAVMALISEKISKYIYVKNDFFPLGISLLLSEAEKYYIAENIDSYFLEFYSTLVTASWKQLTAETIETLATLSIDKQVYLRHGILNVFIHDSMLEYCMDYIYPDDE